MHAGCIELFASKNVRSIADLKDKTVGLRWAGPDKGFVTSMASYVGLDPAKDIRWVAITDRSVPIAQLLAEGKIHAFLAIPPESQELRAQNVGHVIVNWARDRPWSHYFCCMFAGNSEFVRKHPCPQPVFPPVSQAAPPPVFPPPRVARLLVGGGFTPPLPPAPPPRAPPPLFRWGGAPPSPPLPPPPPRCPHRPFPRPPPPPPSPSPFLPPPSFSLEGFWGFWGGCLLGWLFLSSPPLPLAFSVAALRPLRSRFQAPALFNRAY